MNSFYIKKFGLVLIIATFLNIQIAVAQQSTQIPSELQKTISEIEQIYMNKDAERRASSFTDDGVHITGWGQAVKGKEAIRQLYEQTFAQLGEISKVEVMVDNANIAGENAMFRGRFVWEGIKANGEEFALEIHMAALFRKVGNQWKIVWDLTGPQANKE